MTKNRLDWARWIAAAGLLALGWLNYRRALSYTLYMFSDPLEDLSHGWVVPLVSAYAVARHWKELRAAAGQPSWRGLGWSCLLLAVGWFGARGQQERLEQLSLIGMLWAAPYALWGKGVERLLRFPAAYLLFIIPVASYLDFFTIHLRIFASSISTGLLNGLGVSVEQSGTALFSRAPGAAFNVDVADPCSGIRSLFAMMALTAAYAHFTQRTLLQKGLLFACSIPLAVVGNVIRIMSICLVAAWFGQEVATGFYHDYSGLVIFPVSVLLMVELGALIGKLTPRLSRWTRLPLWLRAERAPDGEAARPPRPGRTAFAVVACLLAAACAVVALKLKMPPPAFEEADFVAQALPERVGGFVGDVPWFCHSEQCLEVAEQRALEAAGKLHDGAAACPSCGAPMHRASLGESTVLPADTTISKRNYRAADGLAYTATMVIAGRRRGSIHRPELCLPAQGFAMTSAIRMPVSVAGGSPSVVRRIAVQRAGGQPFSLVYWFFCRDRDSCSHTERILSDIWDRSVHNRINRWVMVVVSVPSALDEPESKARFEAFVSELMAMVRRGRRGAQ